ncbi:MAG: TIGR03986 family CRISPR-associated RAMP protein [Microcoleus sp.]
MNPRHLKQVPNDRKAVAPYNFVELPNKVVEAKLQCNGKLRDNDRYYPDRHTGKIQCTLTTESPLYIRCGMTAENFATYSQSPQNMTDYEKDKWEKERRKILAPFFVYRDNIPVLPGSSLRGMLRSLIEIIGFGKIERVSDQQKFFFRAVAAPSDDPLSQLYKNSFQIVKSGYLELDKKANKWLLRPAQEIEGQLFIEVKEEDIKDELPSLMIMKKANYIPQYIKIGFEVTATSINVSEDLTQHSQQGWLVTSGNMLENMLEKTTERKREELLRKKEGRKYHYIVGEADHSATRIEISPDAIRNYRDALTNFQKGKEKPFNNNPKNRFDEKMGLLQEGLPIFYCEPQNGQPVVTLFGQSPNFRIPYSPNNDGQAASAVDFIPNNVGESDKIDLADAIFGFVRSGKDKKEQLAPDGKKEKREQSRAGRVFISDGYYLNNEDGIWLTEETITPHILASPKPTTFQHYLVQTTKEKPKLKHYASKPNEDTVIRGHKLYWPKGNVKHNIQTDATKYEIEKNRSQYTEIKPIKKGVTFEFTIRFENLSAVELGALLWVLTLAGEDLEKLSWLDLDGKKEQYRLSIGMGKPLGMGAVAIAKYDFFLDERYKNEPEQRYTKLFDGDNWLTGDNHQATADEQKHCVEKFEQYIVNNISIEDCPQGFVNTENRDNLKLKDIPRIRMLLAMLSWNFPPSSETRYMEIERTQQPRLGDDENEYKERRVLPTPFQIVNRLDEDNRQSNNSPLSSNSSSQNQGNGGNSHAATQRPSKPPKR